jgi:hypothetical protein
MARRWPDPALKGLKQSLHLFAFQTSFFIEEVRKMKYSFDEALYLIAMTKYKIPRKEDEKKCTTDKES